MTVDDGVYVVDEVVGLIEVFDAAGQLVSVLEPTVDVIEVFDAAGQLVSVSEPTADVVEIVSSELMGPQGPQGVQGDVGPQGPPGPQGPFAPTFEQYFASPATVWIVQHNLDVYPLVDTFDLNGDQISGDVQMPDRSTVVVTFAVPMAGLARLKA